MTTLRDAAQQALAVLNDICSDSRAAEMPSSRQHWMHCAIDDLRAALGQPEPCDMGDLCIGCTPRTDNVCPGAAQAVPDEATPAMHAAYYECLSAGSGLDAAMVWRAMLDAARKGRA